MVGECIGKRFTVVAILLWINSSYSLPEAACQRAFRIVSLPQIKPPGEITAGGINSVTELMR